ncbi:MAG: AMP-binding protein, partial [Oscillospiraceae bacterium]
MKINLIEYFRETVAKVPNKKAVIEGDRSIDFKTLDVRAKKLAFQIVKIIQSINEPVSVFLPKSIDAVVSDLAITYSGNVYMNLDVKTPAERIKNILETVQPKAIITNQLQLKNIEQILPQDILIFDIDTICENIEEGELLLLDRLEQLIDTDPYCIINTSGSTGTPKGVVLNHKSFFDFIAWSISTLNIGNDEIIGSLSPIVFDIYSHELCMLMTKGSTIVLLPDSLSAFPFKILEILKKQNVTYIFWVPTIMVNIANMDLLSKIELPCLNKIWFAGEVLPTKQYNYWHACLPKSMFVNLYGPIEITLDCTYYIVDRAFSDNEPLPIGKACRNTSVLILNEQNLPCKINEEGELCVRGTSLAMGYYNNPAKTTLAFTQNPLNTKYPELIYRTGDMVMMNEKG